MPDYLRSATGDDLRSARKGDDIRVTVEQTDTGAWLVTLYRNRVVERRIQFLTQAKAIAHADELRRKVKA